MVHAATLQPELAAQSSTLYNLPSLLLYGNDILVVTQTTIEEPAPCPPTWASRALDRFFLTPCCNDVQEQARVQHRLIHMKAVADTIGTTLQALFRPKSTNVRDIAQQWLEREAAKNKADVPKPAEQKPADSHGAVQSQEPTSIKDHTKPRQQ